MTETTVKRLVEQMKVAVVLNRPLTHGKTYRQREAIPREGFWYSNPGQDWGWPEVTHGLRATDFRR